MNAPNPIEHFKPAPLMVLSVVDSLARSLRVRGEFPPPLGEIRCEIVEMTAPVPKAFDPPRALSTFRNRSGYVVVDGTYTNADEPTRRWPLGPGTYRVRVSGDHYQDAEFSLQWPMPDGERRITVQQQPPQPNDPGSVELLPAASYPLPDVSGSRFQLGPTILRGTVFAEDGTAAPGIRVEVINLPFSAPVTLPALGTWPFLAANTDARGDWTLVLPDRRYFDNSPEIPPQPVTKPISIRIAHPNGAIAYQRNVMLGTEFSVRNTSLRGTVLGAGGKPLAGVDISTSVNALTSKTRADVAWQLYFDLDQVTVPNLTVTATTPAGAWATVAAVTLQAQATVVVPTFQFP